MRNMLFQARVVTNPIKNPLIGWWKEYYFFYCKISDLADGENLKDMFIANDWDPSAYTSASSATMFYDGRGINWVYRCTEAVVREYFRDQGEGAFDADKVYLEWPLAQLQGNSWTDSLVGDSKWAAAHSAVDSVLPIGPDDEITGSEIEEALNAWQYARAHNLTELSYEDYLRSNGISVSRERENKPELLRYARSWSYPTNTIDPSTGAPSSAVSWAISERADKDRFFREPGFIIGFSLTRPKIYMTEYLSAMANHMTNPLDWLPAVMSDQPETSFKKFSSLDGPLRTSNEDYWVDLRDLLIYGDQFVNFDAAGATPPAQINRTAIPKADLTKRYLAGTGEILALFVDTDAARVEEDGVARLTIAGSQRDTSPRDLSIAM